MQTRSFRPRAAIAGLTLAALTGAAAVGMMASGSAGAWPIDGYADTGIRRLEEARLMTLGEIEGTPPPAGARWPTGAVDLRLLDAAELAIPEPDPALSDEIVALLGEHADAYAIAVLDLTEPSAPVYAEWRGDYRQNVGSVGKIVGAMGLFQALADAYPNDIAARERVLRETLVTADEFSQNDHHTVHMFDPESRELTRRTIRVGDEATLFEYLDWMLSVSSNSAAAMVMRDAMILRANGTAYPLSEPAIPRFFEGMSGSERTELFVETFEGPLTRNGFDTRTFRQGSFFTSGGKSRVHGGGTSYATVRALMQFALRLEQGKIVDEWTSRQLKRLLYLTERRIRYASAPALRDAAVVFKSGSLYSCTEEPGFTCRQYAGNERNYMNSIAIVEQDVDGKRLHYVVTLISNVLRENSAVAHQTLGTQIHELMLARHAD